jgi:hypothetical protein
MVEVLNRLGRARWRQRLDNFPATIGRSPASTVIVDERDVSATHARVVRAEDGTLSVEDAGSSNGMHVGGNKVPRVVLGQRTEIRLGSVRLRFVSADAPVEKTFVGKPPSSSKWAVLAGVAVPMLVVQPIVERALGYAWALNVAQQIYSGLTVAVTAAVWAFTWALATRIFQGTFRFLEHLAVATLSLVAISVVTSIVLPVFGFALNVPNGGVVASQAAGSLIAVGMLAGHITRVTNLDPWRTRGIALGVVGTFVLLYVVQQIAEEQKPSSELPVQGVVMPPGWQWRGEGSTDALFGQLNGLKEDVDRLREDKH